MHLSSHPHPRPPTPHHPTLPQQEVPGTYIYKRVMDAKYNSVIAGVVPLEVFSSKGFRASAAAAAEAPVLPFLHPALRPEKPEALLGEWVTARGIAPLVEPELVPPPPPKEEEKEEEKGGEGRGEAAGPAGAGAGGAEKDPEAGGKGAASPEEVRLAEAAAAKKKKGAAPQLKAAAAEEEEGGAFADAES